MANTSNAFENRYLEKFDGRNFGLWKWRIQMILNEKGLINLINGNDVCPIDITKVDINTLTKFESDEINDFLIRDNKVYSTICLNLSDIPSRQIKSAKNAREVWMKLENIYETKSS